MKLLVLSLVLISQSIIAQSDGVIQIINRIDIKDDTIKAVYDWVAGNIKYDVNKLEEISNRRRPLKVELTEDELKTKKLSKVIKQKKGVCEDYSLLFDAIVKQLGYRSYIVTGMSKNSKGKINRSLGHAWNVVYVNGVWKFYDTTWGAGYISDRNKFVKKYTTEWFDVSPQEMIKTHLPYDPIWQLLSHPINYSQFEDSNFNIDTSSIMDYNNLIDKLLSDDGKQVLQGQIERSMFTSKDGRLLNKYRKYLKEKLNVYDLRNNPNAIQDAINDFSSSGELYNEYLKKGRSKKFKGNKWTVSYSKVMLQESKTKVDSGIAMLSGIETGNSGAKRMMSKNLSNAKNLSKRLDKELQYLDSLD